MKKLPKIKVNFTFISEPDIKPSPCAVKLVSKIIM